jgi:hypothetical protein
VIAPNSAHILRTLIFTWAAVVAASVQAQVIGGYVPLPGNQRTDGGKVVGVSFNSLGQTISSLGFYDHGGDGLAASYQLGLWDSSQNLIATATVTPSSLLIGDFRYAPITPVTIGTFALPQSFTIGALLPPVMNDIWLDGILPILGVGYTGAGTGRFEVSNSLVYPTNLDSSSYYVVNAGPEVQIPEPNTIGLATGLLTAVAMRARAGRRKKNRGDRI